jgi:hypothetical protein
MNALILNAKAAEALIANQEGQHRLGPVALTDGRYFLMADVLDEPLFADKLQGVTYTTKPFADIAALDCTYPKVDKLLKP